METSERPGRRCRRCRSPSPGRSPWSLVQCHGARRTIPMTSPRRSSCMWGISPGESVLCSADIFCFPCPSLSNGDTDMKIMKIRTLLLYLFVNHADLENISFWLWLCTDCFIEIRILLEGFLLERSGARWPDSERKLKWLCSVEVCLLCM